LSKEEVESLVAPHPDSLNAVTEWLEGHGIKASDCKHSPAKDWITVAVPVSLAEKMLDTVSGIRRSHKEECTLSMGAEILCLEARD